MKQFSILIYILFNSLNFAKCANILLLFQVPSESHTILATSLIKGLTKNGHAVTFASPFKIDTIENCTHIHLRSIYDYKDELYKTEKDVGPRTSKLQIFFILLNWFKKTNELFWEHPDIQKIIIDKPKFDAVIVSSYFNDALLGIPYHLGVPSILFSPIGSNVIGNKYVANPNMVYTKNPFININNEGFFGRLALVTVNYVLNYIFEWKMDPMQGTFLKKYIPNAPPLEDLRNNVSLMLMNSHFSIEPPRPYVPNMIQIGGFHLQNTKKLPEDIQKFLDTAENGAVLFSLGSNVLISHLEKPIQDIIFKVLGELAPIKVLFKSELVHENISENILVKKWLPQADILAHPKIRAFISHGGLGSTTEAVYHGVPILGIPFFVDQKMNLINAEAGGYAAVISHYEEITEDLFREKLRDVLNNSKYKDSIRRRSALIKDQPVKPLDNAIFWIEHIIKYKGGNHLQNEGKYLKWYELYMLDIFVFYTISVSLILYISYRLVKKILRSISELLLKKKTKLKQS